MILKDTRDTFVANVYMPPDGDPDIAYQIITEYIDKIQENGNPDIILLGDFNQDIAKAGTARNRVARFCQLNLHTQLMKSHTHVMNVSKSTIDHIYANNADYYVNAGVTDPGMSDHAVIYVSCKSWKLGHISSKPIVIDISTVMSFTSKLATYRGVWFLSVSM